MFDKINTEVFLIIVIAVVIFLILNYSGASNVKKIPAEDSEIPVTENFMEDSELAPAPASSMPASEPEVVSMLANDTENNLADFYDDNLKGSGNDFNVTGNYDRAAKTNYNDEYTLGVELNDPEFKALGAIPDTNKLISDDLLPKKKEDWFETPGVGTTVEDANLLADAIFRGGVNTLSNANKNPSLDIRGDIPIPKISTGPWNQSSYEAGNKTQGLCI